MIAGPAVSPPLYISSVDVIHEQQRTLISFLLILRFYCLYSWRTIRTSCKRDILSSSY